MQPRDLSLLATPSDPRVSPDGAQVAFVVTTPDLDTNRNRSAVWLVDAAGGAPARRVTQGEHRDARPRWSPDGGRLAFTTHRAEAGCQLMVLPVAGGEAGPVASLPEEIEDVEWSPDGQWLAFLARRRDEAVFGPASDADRPPRRITRLGWRYNGIGWLAGRPRCLWIVPADGTGPARVLVDGDRDVQPGLSWTADSTGVVFAQGRHDTADVDGEVDLWRVEVTSAALSRLSEGGWTCSTPSVSPDGALLAYYRGVPLDVAGLPELRIRRLADSHEWMDDGAASRDRGRSSIATPRLAWMGDQVLLHLIEDRGATPLVAAPGGVVLGGEAVVTGFDHRGATLVATVSRPTLPGELVRVEPDGTVVTLATFPARCPTVAPERFLAPSTGGAEVEAWLLRPAGFDPSERYPVLVNIHGGPHSQYGYGFFDEVQVQAAAGYAVLYANPRGSSGYGAAWGRAIRGPRCDVDPGTGWGGVDAVDVVAVLDEALARYPFLDPDRVGVLGGSYGGYLTSWLIGHTDRFRAACSERAVNNVLSMTHTSDIGWWFNAGYAGVGAEEPEELLRISPVTYADRITTPLLILHSENDFRCPIEQAEDLFLRLRRRGHDVEMVRFPGEDHELSRSGAPKHRLARFEIILEFFARHLAPSPR